MNKNQKLLMKKVFTAMDMVHADLWIKNKKLENLNSRSLIVSDIEISCLKLLVEAALSDLEKMYEKSKK